VKRNSVEQLAILGERCELTQQVLGHIDFHAYLGFLKLAFARLGKVKFGSQ